MLEALFGKLLGWIPSPWSGIRLRHRTTAHLCTSGHPFVFVAGDPWPRGAAHIDITISLWVPEQRTTVHELTAEAAGQVLEANVSTSFSDMTLEPGAKPERESVALGPADDQPLRARAGDTIIVRLGMTRGRARKLKAVIGPEGT